MIFFLRPDTRGPSIDCLFFRCLSSGETTLLKQSHRTVCPFQPEISVGVISTVVVFMILCFNRVAQKPFAERRERASKVST